mmetsp:Transcript_104139/g.334003  ORF Transcript_104139/g.334003 Transcript_104139/m.334003 type:complete len:321 (-) Transcript_104139:66-1028(-)
MAAHGQELARLLAGLQSPNPEIFLSAKTALRDVFGDVGLAKRLGLGLRNPDEEVRYNIACALRDLGPASSHQVALLAAALQDSHICVRQAAAYALGSLGPAGAAHTEDLMLAASEADQDASVRFACVGALKELGVDIEHEQVDPRHLRGRQFAANLRSKGYDAAVAAAAADRGPRSASCDDPNMGSLEASDPTDELRQIALGLTAHAAKLGPALGSQDVRIRQAAAAGLRAMGCHAAPFAQELGAALRDRDALVRQIVAQSLGGLGRAALPFEWDLAELMGDLDENVRIAASRSLQELRDTCALPSPEVVGTLKVVKQLN